MGDDITEVYSPPRVLTVAIKCGLKGSWSIDRLTTNQEGAPWDLTRRAHQAEVVRIIESVRPGLLVGSPPPLQLVFKDNATQLGTHSPAQEAADAARGANSPRVRLPPL